MIISGSALVIGIVVGTLAGLVLGTGGCTSLARNVFPSKRAAKLQQKAVAGKYRATKLNRKLIKNYKRQKMALKLGRMPLLERINHFKYPVNGDRDFDKVWDTTIADKSWKIIGIAKSEKKIAELKGKGVQKATRKVRNIVSRKGKGPMKTYGWTEGEKVGSAAGNGRVNFIQGYGQENVDGTFDSGVDNECLYQMFATSDVTKYGYDPGDLFKNAQDEYRNQRTEENGRFSRFGIDYPTTSSLCPDRFVVGDGSSNKMFTTQKLVMLANACAKLEENPDVKKIRIVDESKSGKKRVSVIAREDVGDYVKDFAKSFAGKSALSALRRIDSNQATAIVDTIRGFVPDFCAGRSMTRS